MKFESNVVRFKMMKIKVLHESKKNPIRLNGCLDFNENQVLTPLRLISGE